MTTTTDPRLIAEALQVDTYDLAAMFVEWSREALPHPDFETRNERGPMSLDRFDERVAIARRHLVAAHETFRAWDTDNPADEE